MNQTYMKEKKIFPLVMSMALPMMLSMAFNSLYNIVDSFFVGRYSDAGLTALSIIYPLQLLMIALAVGTGVGINTAIAHYLGLRDKPRAEEMAGTAAPLGLALWALFAVVCFLILPGYARMSTDSEAVVREVIVYGRIVCVGTTSCRTLESLADENGFFHESSAWTDIFIYPGYRFKVTDALITNFHLPESTLIMLVSALAGREHILDAYRQAVEERYRFFSFGDAMFIH
mgnify:CR=1 FL=1